MTPQPATDDPHDPHDPQDPHATDGPAATDGPDAKGKADGPHATAVTGGTAQTGVTAVPPATPATPVTPVTSVTVDWEKLRSVARDAMSRAYAPYSGYQVGVAGLVDDGRIVSGCNVENASYGLGLCAECGLVSELQNTGGGRLTHFTCVDARGEILVPCGRCRQLLYEFGGAELLLETPAGVLPLSEMLPQAFGPDHLKQRPRDL